MTLSLKLATTTTDTSLPRSYRDPFIINGVLACFDFLNAYCNPNEDGAIEDGAVFHDLVDGGADAVLVAGSGGAVVQRVGRQGLSFPAAANSLSSRIRLGTSRSFYSSRPFTIGAWFKQASDSALTSYMVIAQRTANNANVAEWLLDTGQSGRNPRGAVGLGSSSAGPNPASGANLLSLNAVHQMAFSFTPSGQILLFHDGVQVLSSSGAPATLYDARSSPIDLLFPAKGDLFRFWMERNDTSGRSPAQAVAADFALNTGRFS